VLALFGGLDRQVPPTFNLAPVRAVLAARHGAASVEVVPAVNHQMQTAATGLPDEYGRIPETISPVVLDRIGGWLSEHLKAEPPSPRTLRR
jgi:hypothetical protein